MSNYCSLHVNIPREMRDRMQTIIDSGKYLNMSDATRNYIRIGLTQDEERV